jgi:hypothetical protein
MASQSLVARIRRNHALEHATIHVLSARYPHTPIAGRADQNGFYIVGSLPSEAVDECAREAAARLRTGEGHLAIHPNCGTSFLTAAVLAGAASYLSLLGGRSERWQERLQRLPLAIFSTVLALIVAQPLGVAAQRHITTSSEIGQLDVAAVQRLRRGRATVHRVLTQE